MSTFAPALLSNSADDIPLAVRACRLGQYRILDRLGTGGMGHVYKAEHTVMKRVVALKVIANHLVKDAGAVARFYHEVELAARLVHPNIITAYDAAESDGLHFLVMEYVEGIDLRQLMKESGPLPVAEACEYIRQAALGLQHAHEHGLVHCDIKPANLLIRRTASSCAGGADRPLLKILDFGLARLAGSPSESITILSKSGTDLHYAGTPDYMAPELARDCQAADIRSDLYSLGCTFYYLLTGQVAFPGGTWSEKLLHHQFDPVPSVTELRADVPEPVAAIVHRLLAKDPVDRYQVPTAVTLDLRLWLATQGSAGELSIPASVAATARTCVIGEGLTVLTPYGEEEPPAVLAFPGTRASEQREVQDPSSAGFSTIPSPGRSRPSLLWPAAAIAAIAVGLGIAWYVRPPADAGWVPSMAMRPEVKPAPIAILLRSKPGIRFTRLEAAVDAACDGDTLVLSGNGPFVMTPTSITGKALGIKAGEGYQPRLELDSASTATGVRPLLLTDSALELEGLELAWAAGSKTSASSEATHLVYVQQASLRMVNCCLEAPGRRALVVCRNSRQVELRGCSLAAKSSAICIEVGPALATEIKLLDSNVIIGDSQGAALSLWTSEPGRSVARIRLERNKIEAGRVIAVAGPIQGLQVQADGNDFTFHQALLSCAGLTDSARWRETSLWRGANNQYHGPGNWLLVNGKTVDVSVLPAWRELRQAAEAQLSEQTLDSPLKTALREPAH